MQKGKVVLDNKEFLKVVDGNINLLFSTAKNNVSYKIKTEEGLSNLADLKKIFAVKEVNYTNQIHSSIIFDLNEVNNPKKREGDGLITAKKDEIIGVFAADCVPVLLYDKEKNVIAAVHSGWKGTIGDISKKAAEILRDEYKCENIKVIIGPHVGQCCYEVSSDLAEKFSIKYGDEVVKGRMLSLEKVIRKQLEGVIEKENISSLNLCTNCNREYELHSYRRDGESSGRLFAFAYIK